MDSLSSHFCMFLNSEDMYDPELAMIRSRMVGGTLVLWAKHLDPYVTIHKPATSSFTVMILQLPGSAVTIHVALYLPTSGKDNNFISELTNLRVCLTELAAIYPHSVVFLRGDSNVNSNNKTRVLLLQQFCKAFILKRINLGHTSYHHFTGNGLYDSEIDVLLHTDAIGVAEEVVTILCKHEHPDLLSHHDLIISKCTLPTANTSKENSDDLVTAPRLPNNRVKIIWSPEGAANYEQLVGPALVALRGSWLDTTCTASMSVLLQLTNQVLSEAACATNRTVSLSSNPGPPPTRTAREIRIARQRLRRAHRRYKEHTTPHLSSQCEVYTAAYKDALRGYKSAVRKNRLRNELTRDKRLLTILSHDPSSLYSFIRSSRKASHSKIDKLIVQDKILKESQMASMIACPHLKLVILMSY